MVVKPTLLCNTETWIGVGEKEEKEVKKHHYEILRKCFEQKHGTAYYGIIADTGIWPYKYTIIYKRLMLCHRIIHSGENRIIRRLILNQKESDEVTWYSGVEEWMERLGLTKEVKEIMKIKKSKWKKTIKEGIQKIIEKDVLQKAEDTTKMRFITKFEKQDYISTYNMAMVKDIMRIRLNMVEVGENFRGRNTDTVQDGVSWCLACGKEPETTEHVIECEKYRDLTGHNVNVTENCFADKEWLAHATKAYKRIEETREILKKSKVY